MIELKQVTKRYGAVEAIHEISFTAPKGQIVGLLGQNGAGKTTTLNILTGYMPPTSGEVRVAGMDMLTHARDCKRSIGYLPEKPPLYDEMTVRSYLRFACELKEVERKAIPAHVDRWPIRRWDTSVRPQMRITSSTWAGMARRTTPLSSDAKNRYSRTVISSYSGGCSGR